MLTILKKKKFVASMYGRPFTEQPFIFDAVNPAVEFGRVIGYNIAGTCCTLPINAICDALEYGFATTEHYSLELIN
jgi:hypothetical protein